MFYMPTRWGNLGHVTIWRSRRSRSSSKSSIYQLSMGQCNDDQDDVDCVLWSLWRMERQDRWCDGVWSFRGRDVHWSRYILMLPDDQICDRTIIMIMMMRRRRRQINNDCGSGKARRFQISRSIKGTHHLPQFTQKQVCHGGWNKYSSTQLW